MTESHRRNQVLLGAVVAFCLLQAAAHAAALPGKLPAAAPEQVGMDPQRLTEIDGVVAEGIAAGPSRSRSP